MFYSPEILSMRKKGKLARCWLAATLSDRLFKKTVSNKVVLSIDITVTCDEILKMITTDTGNRKLRFSLYLSSQLVYGTTKLLNMQVTIFQVSLFRVKTDLNPIDMASKKKKRTFSETTEIDMTIEEPPPVIEAFKDLQLRADIHRMPEIDIQSIRRFNLEHCVDTQHFGALTDEELDILLLNDGDIRMVEYSDRTGFTIDESRDQPRSPGGHTTDPHHLGISGPLEFDASAAGASAQLPRAAQKRHSTTTNLDTPAKRPRRGLREESDVAVEDKTGDIPYKDVEVLPPLDEFPEMPPERFVEPPSNLEVPPIDESEIALPLEAPAAEAPAALPAQEPIVDVPEPVDGNLHLESLELEAPRPQTGKRARKIRRIDDFTQLPEAEIGKSLFDNFQIHTTPWIPPVPDRKRGLLADLLLRNPVTNRRRRRVNDCNEWADALINDFEKRTQGPFTAQNDDFMNAEAIRLVTNTRSFEISKKHGDTTGFEASARNKTTDDPSSQEHDQMALPAVPDVLGVVPEASMVVPLPDVTNEPLPNISEAPEDDVMPAMEILQNIDENSREVKDTVSNTKLPQSDVRMTMTNRQSTSDPNTGDIDAFLPPKLRKKSLEKKISQKSSTPEAIVDLRESPASINSQNLQSTWNIPELLANLEVLWRDRRQVRFQQDLVPREVTRRIDAACCFNMLLGLSKEKKVVLEQTRPYGTIYISKRAALRSSMDWEET